MNVVTLVIDVGNANEFLETKELLQSHVVQQPGVAFVFGRAGYHDSYDVQFQVVEVRQPAFFGLDILGVCIYEEVMAAFLRCYHNREGGPQSFVIVSRFIEEC